ncbi:uncharacterized protein LOC103385478 isoform X2 [Cynoglossus semilaevis]|uniref:uncharacterized protein LOC103385478 isoform X2 n=1 Tax=Cynoglossus semilaevis TaxID=244447 RepID=UPI0007DCB4A0|nr:interleukin-17 receptor E isoform X2 [Cynoglossus semilaevis]
MSASVEGPCPIKLVPVPSLEPGQIYSECVSLHVWINTSDMSKSPKIEILSPFTEILRTNWRKSRKKTKCKDSSCDVWCPSISQQGEYGNSSVALQWELLYDCISAKDQTVVTVTFSTTTSSCSHSHTVTGPVPRFDLSVDQSSKSVTVRVEADVMVRTRWCYHRNGDCVGNSSSVLVSSSSAVLRPPHLLPCVCVQVYYTYLDAPRHHRCPFQNQPIRDVSAVWRSSLLQEYQSYLRWSSVCPADTMDVSAHLCWGQQGRPCLSDLNSTLDKREDGRHLVYDITAVDRHPQMCVKLSLQDSHHVSCPFQSAVPSWLLSVRPNRQSVLVSVTSSVPAVFSCQLCVVQDQLCSPLGGLHTLILDGTSEEGRIPLSPRVLLHRPCVQVWQSDPHLLGKRVICPDYTHSRCGVYAVLVLLLVLLTVALRAFISRLSRGGAGGWLQVQRPVLLVCSSEGSAHVTAVCALASVLKAELNATVHLSLWAHNSQPQVGGAGRAVADVGPLPWLYGQWDAVRQAEGNILMVWSPEAKVFYEKLRNTREKKTEGGNKGEDRTDVRAKRGRSAGGHKQEGRSFTTGEKENAAGEERSLLHDDTDQETPLSAVIAPMFAGALTCLQGALQQSKDHRVSIVYFQGLGHSRDIPKTFKDLPCYCLPQEFRGLLQRLGGINTGADPEGTLKVHCWQRLLAKVQCLWLSRQLAYRLRTQLPHRSQDTSNQVEASRATDRGGSGPVPEPVHSTGTTCRTQEFKCQGTKHQHEELEQNSVLIH